LVKSFKKSQLTSTAGL